MDWRETYYGIEETMEAKRSMRLHKKVMGSGLVERAPEPALISIGLPLPGLTIDIPGLIEINGGAQKTTTTSSTHVATTATTAHATTTANSGSTKGSGGSSSGGNGGAATQTGSSSKPTDSSSGGSGSSSGNSGSSGNGSGDENGGGSSDNSGSGGGGSSVSGSLSTAAPGSTQTASAGAGSGSGSSSDIVGGSSVVGGDSSGGSVSPGATLSGAPSAVINIAGDPSVTATTDSNGDTVFLSGSVTITSVHGTSTATKGSGSGSTVNGGTTSNGNGGNSSNGNNGSSGNGNTTTSGSDASSSGKVSAGVIAAICVVVGLVLLFLFLFGLRRWHKKRRTQRLRDWADRSKKGGLFMFGAFSEKPATAVSANTVVAGSRSARSSFGTTIEHTRPFSPLPAFDQTLSENTLFFTPLPSPTATGMQSATSVIPDMPPVSIPQTAIIRPPSRNSSVFSIGSDSSHGSSRESNGAQYLSLPPMHPDNVPQLSPISVRPFSPSESWAFPKPPTNPPTPPSTLRPLSGASAATEMPVPPIPVARPAELPSSPNTAGLRDPFADAQEIPDNDPFADPQLTPTLLVPIKGLDIPVQRPTSSGTMHTTSTAGGSEVSLGVLDVIRRPFVPTLEDELAVKRGDQIRVLQCFDDGWAQIEKLETGEAGLIPVDCLREAGEELPDFLAARRVSSYYGGVAV